MRCPKCHYLGFEPEPRCKNCGYSFSADDADLALKVDEAEERDGPDLVLRDGSTHVDDRLVASVRVPAYRRERASYMETVPLEPLSFAWVPARSVADPVVAWVAAVDVAVAPAPAPRSAIEAVPTASTAELPLFVKGTSASVAESAIVPDEPLGHESDETRLPLSVRRKTRDHAKPKAPARKLGPLDRDLLEDLQRIDKMEEKEAAAEKRVAAHEVWMTERVGAGRRLGAAVLDLLFAAGLATGILSATLRWLDLPMDRLSALPVWPMAAFLVLMNSLYVLMFTAAGGQTLGKMVLGIRVVSEAIEEQSITLRQAAYRTLVTVPSILALGAGFVPALVGDERALHDRLAHTRVVKA